MYVIVPQCNVSMSTISLCVVFKSIGDLKAVDVEKHIPSLVCTCI